MMGMDPAILTLASQQLSQCGHHHAVSGSHGGCHFWDHDDIVSLSYSVTTLFAPFQVPVG